MLEDIALAYLKYVICKSKKIPRMRVWTRSDLGESKQNESARW